MQRFVTIFFSFLLIAVVSGGCDYLAADDSCYPIKTVTSCSEYNDEMESCDPYTFPNAQGCYIEEVCTDLNDDQDTDASVDTDSTPGDGQICSYQCGGEPVPCEVMNKENCDNTVYCKWWHDPNNIDADLE
ncbi:MAG: hypothetical protein JXX29_11325 [Deltaproteobacteria bacterium]|nr:hypothetical protein [Deltaproteobacteria bacterium]MBN2672262.1 hypothetical protein [Deltaproteobacteria bacterium]